MLSRALQKKVNPVLSSGYAKGCNYICGIKVFSVKAPATSIFHNKIHTGITVKRFILTTNEIKRKRSVLQVLSFSINTLLGIVIVIISFIILFLVYMSNGYEPRYSMIFFGESKEYEKEVEREMNFPFSKVVPRISQYCLAVIIGADVKKIMEQFKSDYPNLWLGDAYLAIYYKKNQDKEKALSHLNEAARIAMEYPEENAFLNKYLELPSEKDLYCKPWTTLIKEVKPGRIWTVDGPLEMEGNIIPIQSTLVKQRDGSIVIVNPTGFPNDIIEKINKLGPVKSIVTTTIAHSYALTLAHKIWPNAKIYGTDAESKHNEPNLDWNFLTKENPNEISELHFIPIEGSLLKEGVFYDAASKTLLGFTDNIYYDPTDARSRGTKNWQDRAYHFGVGVIRGPVLPEKRFANYHYAGAKDLSKYRESINKILDLDIDCVTFGHVGVTQGKKAKQELIENWSWLTDPKKQWTKSESFLLPIKWALTVNFPKVVLNALILQLKPK